MATLHELRLDPELVKRCVISSFKGIANEAELIRLGRYNNECSRRYCIIDRFSIALISSIVGHDAWVEFGLDVVQPEVPIGTAMAVDYFHGPWRDAYKPWDDEDWIWDRKKCRAELEWVDPFREGLICALYTEDRDAFNKILAYPAGGGLADLEGTLDRTREDRAFYELLGAYGAGNQALVQQQLEVVRNVRRTRVKLLASMFEAMLVTDTKAFTKSTNKYLAGYRKSEFRTNRLDVAISLDGTIVWHLGRFAHCADIEQVKPELRPLLLALPPV